MANIKIQAQSRTETKKMKPLIDEGYIPGVIYDQKGNSETIKIPSNIIDKLLTDSQKMPLVEIKVDDGASALALLKEVQIDRRKNLPNHLSFMKLDPKKKAVFTVDIALTGESPAVKNSLGILLVTKTDLELRGLPEDVPSSLKADISTLEDVGDIITVENLSIPEKLEFINDDILAFPVVTIQPFQKTIEDEKPATEGEIEGELEEGEEGEAEVSEDGEVTEGEPEEGAETAIEDQGEDQTSKQKPEERR